jgi:hypothetical protein
MHKTWRVKSPFSEGINLEKARSVMGPPSRLQDVGKAISETSVESCQRAKVDPSELRIRL